MNVYKLVVIRDCDVGKTALTIQLCLNHFVESYKPTIKDSYQKQAMIDGQICKIEIIDIGGQEEYTALRDQSIRAGEGFVLVYSILSRLPFTGARKHHENIQRVKESSKSLSSSLSAPGPASIVPVMLVGNKSDRVTNREVSVKEGHALAKGLGCKFVEASAKNVTNVEKVFYDVVRLLHCQRQVRIRQLPSRGGSGAETNNNQDPVRMFRLGKSKKCVIL